MQIALLKETKEELNMEVMGPNVAELSEHLHTRLEEPRCNG